MCFVYFCVFLLLGKTGTNHPSVLCVFVFFLRNLSDACILCVFVFKEKEKNLRRQVFCVFSYFSILLKMMCNACVLCVFVFKKKLSQTTLVFYVFLCFLHI